MSKTPRTDVASSEFAGKEVSSIEAGTMWSLCRELETEPTNRNDAALELLRQIRDNEVNPQDEADKFLRDHVPSKLSAVTEAFRRQAANMAFVINHIQLLDVWYKKFTDELEQDREYVNQQIE